MVDEVFINRYDDDINGHDAVIRADVGVIAGHVVVMTANAMVIAGHVVVMTADENFIDGYDGRHDR